MIALVEPGADLTPAQRHRYARHLLMPRIGELGQRRLLNARVAVVGAGGLGSPALLYLAAAGVGHLTIIDDDDIDATNLQRQVLHSTQGLGAPKVDSAAFRLHALNPGIEVTTHRVRLDADNAARLLAGHHVVLDGADNFDTRYVVADACEHLGITHVWASVFRTQAQLSVFRRPDPAGEGSGIGLRDVFPTAPDTADVPSCADAGVLGSLCGQVGSMMATETIKLVCGIGRPLFGRLVFVDALDATQREIAVRPAASSEPTMPAAPPMPGTSVPGGATAITDADVELVEPSTLAQLLDETSGDATPPLVLDVREPAEWEMGTIDGARLISLGELLDGAEVPLDQPVVVTCKTGPRALRAAAELRRRGALAVSVLAGGMVGWAAMVDPSMIRY